MLLRIKKLHKRFLLLAVLFCFSVLTINLAPQYSNVIPNTFFHLALMRNYTNAPEVTTPKPNLWDHNQGGDRIQDQVNFKTYIDVDKVPRKKILIQYGTGGWGVRPGNEIFLSQECNVNHCELLDTPPDGDAVVDARMFKENDISLFDIERFLKETRRTPDQVWIMFALESPMASPIYGNIKDVLNWTATYRPDSTLMTPYDKWMPFGNVSRLEDAPLLQNYTSGKSKKVAVFVSNCAASNKRKEYVNALKAHIAVDVYGACGELSCGRDDDEKCFNMLKKDYKFYLAFENANCRHYITEKLFLNALHYDVVPVVMGAHPDDYRRVAPPGSYIHVEDYDSPEDLAKYLNYLDQNDKAYNEYFRWKTTGYFYNTKFWCRICAMLWDPERPPLSVDDLERWWRGDGVCINDNRWTPEKKKIE